MTCRRLRKHLFAPVFAGYIYDITGSYQFAFLTFTLLAALSTASFHIVKSERI